MNCQTAYHMLRCAPLMARVRVTLHETRLGARKRWRHAAMVAVARARLRLMRRNSRTLRHRGG
ncbi:MAG: hypothetical protein ACREI9_09780 [Nitrospiraceae bacterium]